MNNIFLQTSTKEESSPAENLVLQLQQARTLANELCHALKTSHKLVNALLDGNASDKLIGKYILQTFNETGAVLDRKSHKELLLLLDKSISDLDSNKNEALE